jgi:hypothetical protein
MKLALDLIRRARFHTSSLVASGSRHRIFLGIRLGIRVKLNLNTNQAS